MDASDVFGVDHSDPGVLKLQGELDMQTAELVFAALESMDGQGFDIDLSGITFVDSSGLRAMLRIRRDHHGARFVCPSPQIVRLLETTGMTNTLGIDKTSSGE